MEPVSPVEHPSRFMVSVRTPVIGLIGILTAQWVVRGVQCSRGEELLS